MLDENIIKWQLFKDGKRTETFVKETDENTTVLNRKS